MTYRLLPNDGLLNFHNLSDMIRSSTELSLLNPLINTHEHVPVHIPTVINTPEVLYEILHFHSSVLLEMGSMEVCVEHDDSKSQNENCVRTITKLRSGIERK